MIRAAIRAARRWWLGYRIANAYDYLRGVDESHPMCSAIWAGHLLQIADWEIERSKLAPMPTAALAKEIRIMSKVREFFSVWRLYAKHHPPLYAARIAWGIAFKGLPF